MWEAYSKRKALKQVAGLRSSMIAGVWGNSNYDDEKNSRKKILDQIDSFYQQALMEIYGEPEEEIDFDENPFFAAMQKPHLEMRE